MAKKMILAMVLAAFIGGSAAAQIRYSAGAGGYITSDFGGGAEWFAGGIKGGSLKTPYFGGGAFFFFDMKFIEIDLGLFGSGGNWEDYGYGLGTDKHKVSHTAIDIGALAKYPFNMNEKVALFPLLGIVYRGFISTKMDGVKIPYQEDLNALWFKFGGGLDYSLSEKAYIRWETLYGIRFSNTFEDDMVDLFEYSGAPSADTLLGHGIEVKFALGYRF
jgi:hypothetical protein